jgi:hypothetical protein
VIKRKIKIRFLCNSVPALVGRGGDAAIPGIGCAVADLPVGDPHVAVMVCRCV